MAATPEIWVPVPETYLGAYQIRKAISIMNYTDT